MKAPSSGLNYGRRKHKKARCKHSLLHAYFLFFFILTPKGGRHISLKRLLTFLGLHDVFLPKIEFFEDISVYFAHLKDLVDLVRRKSVEVVSFKEREVAYG
jgi:hypothetical protein